MEKVKSIYEDGRKASLKDSEFKKILNEVGLL